MAAAAAEAAAAEARIRSKVKAMKADGHPAWKVQTMEVEERKNILSSISTKLQELNMKNRDLQSSSLSEAERDARKAEAEANRSSLLKVYLRVSAGIRTPDYSGMTEAERAAEAERLRQKKLEKARRLERDGEADWWIEERRARITDFDPKQYGLYYNRMTLLISDPKFDIDHESPFGPMRFTDKVYGKDLPYLDDAINILSVNIACSDVGFPIQVYGSVIARDSIDHKCINLFRRDRDHCQFITSKDDPLILTGPKRGLVLTCDNYVETDLKIKDHLGQEREFSKGILSISAVRGRSLEDSEVERSQIETRLSTVDVLYAAVKCALEGTVEVRVLQGRFYGTITAHITSVQDKIMLYDDSKSDRRAKSTRCARGVIQLMRSVVCVPLRDMLIIDVKMSTGKYACLNFTPKYSGVEGVVIALGTNKMRVKLAWSVMVDR